MPLASAWHEAGSSSGAGLIVSCASAVAGSCSITIRGKSVLFAVQSCGINLKSGYKSICTTETRYIGLKLFSRSSCCFHNESFAINFGMYHDRIIILSRCKMYANSCKINVRCLVATTCTQL